MSIDLILPLSMAMGVAAWSLVFLWFAHPWLTDQPFERAIRPVLLLHAFRFIGLMFLIPGVTTEPLDPRFAWPAAYGDLVAAVLAFAALGALAAGRRVGLAAVWVFNAWGLADLVNAVARGIRFVPDGDFGAAFWIPMVIVPLLVVTHVYVFGRLVREWRRKAVAALPVVGVTVRQ
jgi:hypothetical protein